VPLSIRAVVFPSLATIAKNIPVLWNKKKLFVNVLFLTAYFSRFQCFDIPLKRTKRPLLCVFMLARAMVSKSFFL